LDPWGGETARSSDQAFQPHRYTTYERDSNGGDEAMMRRYTGKFHRFTQPDPADGSYDFTNPQSFNRYAYVQNDPVNFIDPLGLEPDAEGGLGSWLSLQIGLSNSVNVFGGFGGGDGGEMVEPIDPEKQMIAENPGRQIVPLGNLQNGLRNLLKTGDCAVFLQKLINTLNESFGGGRPHATSFWDAFSRIKDAGGFQLKDVPNGGTVGGDLFFGELVNPALPENSQAGPGTVYITPWGPIGRAARPAEAASAQARYVYRALHETLHLAIQSWHYDKHLARAAHKVDGTTAPKFGDGDYLSWSGNFDEVLKKHCTYSSQ
jgi:RHS repeat-associated protein